MTARAGTSAATRVPSSTSARRLRLLTDDPFLRKVFPGSYHAGQVNSLFCDGFVRPLRATMNRDIWYGVLTRDGKELINSDAF